MSPTQMYFGYIFAALPFFFFKNVLNLLIKLSVLFLVAEVTRLFMPYQSTSRSLTPRQRPRPLNFGARGTVATYSHTFCCLNKKSTTMTPNRYQKLELANAGLGEKRVNFQGKPMLRLIIILA